MAVNRGTVLVFVIGVAIGLLVLAFLAGAPLAVNAAWLAAFLVVVIWLLTRAPSAEMLPSLLGIGLGVVIALVIPQIALGGFVEPGVAFVGVVLLLLTGVQIVKVPTP